MKRVTEPCPQCKGTGKLTVSPVRTLRIRAGLKQGEVAERLGVTQGHLSKIESGEVAPHYQASKLGELFGVSPEAIRGEDPLPEPKAVRPIVTPPAARLKASKRRRARTAAKNKRRK